MMIANSTAATIATDTGYAGFVLAQLSCAALRARLVAAEIDSAAVALRGGLIDADGAMAWMAEIGALGFMSAAVTSVST
jgi:hypothetical protein